jgi:hypothetical protein
VITTSIIRAISITPHDATLQKKTTFKLTSHYNLKSIPVPRTHAKNCHQIKKLFIRAWKDRRKPRNALFKEPSTGLEINPAPSEY